MIGVAACSWSMPMPTSDMIAGSASTITYVSIAAISTDAAAIASSQLRRPLTPSGRRRDRHVLAIVGENQGVRAVGAGS